jgi:hypothetical protein
MGKLKFGHDPRKLAKVPEREQNNEKQQTVTNRAQTVLLEKLVQAEPVPEKTVIVETRHTETTVLKESRDKWARKHSKLSTRKMEKLVDEMCETLNQQNEMVRFVRKGIHSLVEKQDDLVVRLKVLESQKSEQIQVVTEKTIVKSEVPKMIWVILGILALTNAYLLMK